MLKGDGATEQRATDKRWDQVIPVAAPAETGKFLTRVRTLVNESGCTLVDPAESPTQDLSAAPGIASEPGSTDLVTTVPAKGAVISAKPR